MPSSLDWAEAATTYLDRGGGSGVVAGVIEQLRERDPFEITTALDPEVAEAEKAESTRFLLYAIREAVADHALTDDEVRSLIQVRRVFRIHEGDLLEHHPDEVAQLLCQELERLLEDEQIDPDEAVHKVKLQEILGLSYDQFLELTAPEVDRILLDLLEFIQRFNQAIGESYSLDEAAWFRRRLLALDTVYDLDTVGGLRGPRSGYLYLLVNPAMPGLVKIGRTSRKPDQRVAELTAATGVPTPFILVYHQFVRDAVAAEEWVHSRLSLRGARTSPNREFFSVTPIAAVKVMMDARTRSALA